MYYALKARRFGDEQCHCFWCCLIVDDVILSFLLLRRPNLRSHFKSSRCVIVSVSIRFAWGNGEASLMDYWRFFFFPRDSHRSSYFVCIICLRFEVSVQLEINIIHAFLVQSLFSTPFTVSFSSTLSGLERAKGKKEKKKQRYFLTHLNHI